jgi:hypothetical protein
MEQFTINLHAVAGEVDLVAVTKVIEDIIQYCTSKDAHLRIVQSGGPTLLSKG